jgi:hypothetical protein
VSDSRGSRAVFTRNYEAWVAPNRLSAGGTFRKVYGRHERHAALRDKTGHDTGLKNWGFPLSWITACCFLLLFAITYEISLLFAQSQKVSKSRKESLQFSLQ